MKNFSCHEVKSCYFLASGGRDRLIHLYDVERLCLQLVHLSSSLDFTLMGLLSISGISILLEVLMIIQLLWLPWNSLPMAVRFLVVVLIGKSLKLLPSCLYSLNSDFWWWGVYYLIWIIGSCSKIKENDVIPFWFVALEWTHIVSFYSVDWNEPIFISRSQIWVVYFSIQLEWKIFLYSLLVGIFYQGQ